MKNVIKKLRRALSRGAVYFFVTLFEALPYNVSRAITWMLLKTAFFFMGEHRRIAEQTVNIAFSGEKPIEEQRQIISDCFESLAKSAVETACCSSSQQLMEQLVTVEGEERLKKALAQGRGVIAVTAHFGNFPLMMIYFASKGYPMKCIVRPLRDNKLEVYLTKKYMKAGFKSIHSIPRRECVVQSLKSLRNKEILFIPIDQNLSTKGGVFVKFFGRDASTPTGPIVFARRSGAMILPIFIVRQKNDTHKIIIEEPFEVVEKDSEQETRVFNMQKITTIVEKYIRQYPSQWAWMNHRWKAQPYKRKGHLR